MFLLIGHFPIQRQEKSMQMGPLPAKDSVGHYYLIATSQEDANQSGH